MYTTHVESKLKNSILYPSTLSIIFYRAYIYIYIYPYPEGGKSLYLLHSSSWFQRLESWEGRKGLESWEQDSFGNEPHQILAIEKQNYFTQMFPNDFKATHRSGKTQNPFVYMMIMNWQSTYIDQQIPLNTRVLNESVKSLFWIIIGILSAKLKLKKESLKAKTCFCMK